MKVLFIICSLLVSVCCYAQSENELFEKSKGTLTPVLKNGIRLKVENIDESIRPKNAVYITYSADSARAVFDGKVSEILEIPNHAGDYVIMVSSGDYAISYSFLRKPIVAVGETVKRGQSMGPLAPVPMGPYYFIMQIYKGETELNAWEWFAK